MRICSPKLDFSGIHTLVWPFVSYGAKSKFVHVSSGIVSHNNLKTVQLFLEATENDVWKGTEQGLLRQLCRIYFPSCIIAAVSIFLRNEREGTTLH